MRTFFTLLRGLGLIALLAGLLAPSTVSAQADTATLTVLSMSCPRGYSGPDYYETCQSPLIPDNPFSIIGPLGEVERVTGPEELNVRDRGRTDALGTIVFDALDPGKYELLGGLPGDLGGVASYCYQSGDPSARVPSRTTGTDQSYRAAPGPGSFSTFVTLTAGDAVTCEIYAIGTPLDPYGSADSSASSPAPSTTTPVTPAAGPASGGSNAAIYAGTCDTNGFSDPVAELTDVTTPAGAPAGSTDVPDVETSRTTIDQPLDDLLADDHVLVVFDEDDATVPLACGAIGGVVTDDGSLAIGLPRVGESRYSGVAVLTPEAGMTNVTIFLVENLLGVGGTPAT